MQSPFLHFREKKASIAAPISCILPNVSFKGVNRSAYRPLGRLEIFDRVSPCNIHSVPICLVP